MNLAAELFADFPDDLSPELFSALPGDKAQHYEQFLAYMQAQGRRQLFYDIYPDNDNVAPNGVVRFFARVRYFKHLEFFEAGAKYRERCALFGNRCGKTTAAAFEITCHLTGVYPEWWVGRRFAEPIMAWACGKSGKTTRDIVQQALFGGVVYDGPRRMFSGRGMVPAEFTGRPTWSSSTAELIDTILVKHASGGWSKLGLKSYEQGRGAFEGTAQHVIWLDEECPLDVYGECVIRTATTNGIVMLTFTPLEGLTPTVLQFIESGD